MADVRQSDTINSMIQLNIPREKKNFLVEIVRKPSPSPLRIWVKEDECLDDSQPRGRHNMKVEYSAFSLSIS